MLGLYSLRWCWCTKCKDVEIGSECCTWFVGILRRWLTAFYYNLAPLTVKWKVLQIHCTTQLRTNPKNKLMQLLWTWCKVYLSSSDGLLALIQCNQTTTAHFYTSLHFQTPHPVGASEYDPDTTVTIRTIQSHDVFLVKLLILRHSECMFDDLNFFSKCCSWDSKYILTVLKTLH